MLTTWPGYGAKLGTRLIAEAAIAANRHLPELAAFDAGGQAAGRGAVFARPIIS